MNNRRSEEIRGEGQGRCENRSEGELGRRRERKRRGRERRTSFRRWRA
jgi:hypothetical protein